MHFVINDCQVWFRIEHVCKVHNKSDPAFTYLHENKKSRCLCYTEINFDIFSKYTHPPATWVEYGELARSRTKISQID